jgi:Na+/melibiose symporter-like transporter
MEATRFSESFKHKDVTHLAVKRGRPIKWFWRGLVLAFIGFIGFIAGVAEKPMNTNYVLGSLVLLAIGVCMMLYVFFGNRKAYLFVDFSKNVPIESWTSAESNTSWIDFICIPCYAQLRKLLRGNASSASTSRELSLARKDGDAAMSAVAKHSFFIV